MRGTGSIRRLTTWASVGCYLLVASGLPLPLGVVGEGGRGVVRGERGEKDRSLPFPCMDSPCGCSTAEQCYTNCCCHSPTERMAWARARGLEEVVAALVEPRSEATLAIGVAAGEPADETASGSSSCCEKLAMGSCCGSSPEEPLEHAGDTSPETSASFGHGRGSEPPAGSGSGDDPERAGRSVSLRSMLACSGILSDWLAAGVSLPPPAVAPLWRLSVCHDRLELVDDSIGSSRPAPDAPPPRSV